jgi:3-deoxy-manno-octulosonate cytidylyltransferase (CMP-KDO synthetase)
MNVVGVIPARWGSTRLPGKSLILICGKPLIQWVVESARKARRLESLLVATDDERIVEAVKGLGVKAVMTRPDHPSGTDRIAEAVEGLDVKVVVNIQGDEPMMDPGLIDRLADVMLQNEQWDMATAASPILSETDLKNPSVVKVVWNEKRQALYFSRSTIPHVRDQDMGDAPRLHWRHLGIYAYRKAFLNALVKTPPCLLERAEKLEQLRALHIGARMVVLETGEAGIGVDTPEDVPHVEKALGGRPAKQE